jgi:putative mRNA 3-end processing factor
MAQMMEWDAFELRHGNGIEITMGDLAVRFDPKRLVEDGHNCISHAHSDHLPSKMLTDKAIASRITLRCASERVRKHLRSDHCDRIKMFDSGHIRGSSMFLVENGQRVLYTGDLCTRDRFGLEGGRPVKTDILIIESTFGSKRWRFPPREEIGGVMRDWIEDNLAQDRSVALFTYPIGKSQLILSFLGHLQPFLLESVLTSTRLVEEGGDERFQYRAFEDKALEEPSVMICSTGAKRSAALESKVRDGRLKTAVVTGWALMPGCARRMGVDEAFALSDHSGYDELLEFVKGCDPRMVYTNHGYDEELATAIRNELGIAAQTIDRKQRCLVEF